MTSARIWIVAASLATLLLRASAVAGTPEEDQAAYFNSPAWLGQKYVGASEWTKLDALVEQLAASRERAEDGRFQLYMLTSNIDQWLEKWDEDQDAGFRQKFEEYRTEFPKSAFEPILAAMQVHSTAWRARGRGFSSSVTPEGWTLFAERSKLAWKMLIAAKPSSSRLPTWYEQSISVGLDAGVPGAEVTALFNEGIKRFPGYHPLYFTYARQFSPRWGGSYQAADAFIRSQVSAKTNPEGEILYARLYWLIDQFGGGDADFFTESQVDWPRMRQAFELLMKQFPKSAWNQANLVSFACRAGDADTYVKWRITVDADRFVAAAPDGISLEVCDARFAKKT